MTHLSQVSRVTHPPRGESSVVVHLWIRNANSGAWAICVASCLLSNPGELSRSVLPVSPPLPSFSELMMPTTPWPPGWICTCRTSTVCLLSRLPRRCLSSAWISTVEVGTVGPEGAIGMAVGLGSRSSFISALVQVSGTCLPFRHRDFGPREPKSLNSRTYHQRYRTSARSDSTDGSM